MILRSLLVITLIFAGTAHGQAFDPANVDWDKLSKIPMTDGFIRQYNTNCAACHGEDLRGMTLGPPLVGVDLKYGDSAEEIAAVIRNGVPGTEMPAWKDTLRPDKIWNMALYVAEQRQGTTILDKNDKIEIALPAGPVETERHDFVVTKIAEGLDAMPFGIAPLPDGRILLTERMRGLRIVNTDGSLSDYIKDTPPAYDDSGSFLGQVQGLGWMLDVELHPDYAENGWIYLHHTDRCSGCNDLSRRADGPVSMNRIVRGRIKDGRWADQQIIWQADVESYTNTSDLAAGGRLAFDDENFVYFTTGIKDSLDIFGIQDKSLPHGKVHRVHDDGRIPADNPFVDVEGALPSIYTLGHRSVQGLTFNAANGELWETEMGPRGGDELNRLRKGANYGWPVFTNGVNYTGMPIKIRPSMGIALDEADATFPVVDWTPAVAISNLLFYSGDEFPQWRGNIIAGTLRATDLLRMEVTDGEVTHTEVLLENLARFRDVAHGPGGELYLLLENKAGSMIVRIAPATTGT
ncbi:MAG: c-type cytochrome [Gammaproteobacteria bacterium]|nr:c-type cytochrome [Gammaproteobacteria bacterium]